MPESSTSFSIDLNEHQKNLNCCFNHCLLENHLIQSHQLLLAAKRVDSYRNFKVNWTVLYHVLFTITLGVRRGAADILELY